jgi:hypothetical protein
MSFIQGGCWKVKNVDIDIGGSAIVHLARYVPFVKGAYRILVYLLFVAIPTSGYRTSLYR